MISSPGREKGGNVIDIMYLVKGGFDTADFTNYSGGGYMRI